MFQTNLSGMLKTEYSIPTRIHVHVINTSRNCKNNTANHFKFGGQL